MPLELIGSADAERAHIGAHWAKQVAAGWLASGRKDPNGPARFEAMAATTGLAGYLNSAASDPTAEVIAETRRFMERGADPYMRGHGRESPFETVIRQVRMPGDRWVALLMELVRARPGVLPQTTTGLNLLEALQLPHELSEAKWRLGPFILAWAAHLESDEPGAERARRAVITAKWLQSRARETDGGKGSSFDVFALPLFAALAVWERDSTKVSAGAARRLWISKLEGARFALPPDTRAPDSRSGVEQRRRVLAKLLPMASDAIQVGVRLMVLSPGVRTTRAVDVERAALLESVTSRFLAMAVRGGLDLDAPVDLHKHTLLQLTAALGTVERVALLIQAGANPGAIGAHGMTATEFAHHVGRNDTMQWLAAAQSKALLRGASERATAVRAADRQGPSS
jgi:hypothetical protein